MLYKKVLVIGGTKQMGVHLVEELLRENYDVTVANRGKTGDNFGNRIKRIIFDRFDEKSVAKVFQGENAMFDAIIDTIAYNGSAVEMMFKYVQTKKYIQFSAISVYTMLNINQSEEDFNPIKFDTNKFTLFVENFTMGDAKYQLGKKAAEKAALKCNSNAVIIRIPMVTGEDATSPMLRQLTKAVALGEEIHLDRCKYERKFAITNTREPGRFAVYALKHDISGIYNIASNGYVTNKMLVSYLENKMMKKANIVWGDKNDCFHVDFPEHTLDTTKARDKGFEFNNVEDWLFSVLDKYASSYKNVPNKNILLSNNNATNNLLTSMGEIVYRFLMATKYGGSLFDYLDDFNISEFDMYVEEEAISFLPVLFNCARRTPENIYANIEGNVEVKAVLSGKEKVTVKPLTSAVKNENKRAMINFCHWNYQLYKKIESLNYINISLIEMADYSLYKNVILIKCRNYLQSIGVKCLFTKFPQANRINNQSKLEKYLSNNGIYGVVSESAEYGLNMDEVYEDTNATTKLKQGVYKYTDVSSEHFNIVNGFRVTKDIPVNAHKKIWLFGSSVVLGFYADDEHTIASGLQKEINCYFGENVDYSVVNASNYSGNDVGVVPPYLESLPIENGDICVFNMEFPIALLEKYSEIIDLSSYFARPHNYGEIFADIKHMVGRGYSIQGKVLFDLLKNGGYFEQEEEQVRVQGYCEVASDSNFLSEKENAELFTYLQQIQGYRKKIGAIVMNCNPFTLGHRYLIEESAKKVDQLYIFVVEEDKSFFSFEDRFELVKKGTADLDNVVVLPSGQFIISQRTFEAYSNKAELQDTKIDASLDVEIFARRIAPTLGINIRFAGEEPLDNVTQQYNDTMQRILPRYGIQFEVIPRKEWDGQVISASRVRALLEKKQFEDIKKIVPITTYDYLYNKYKDSKRVLVLGGTRFMGIRLVEQMIERNWFVTLATRGIHTDSFGKNVTRIKLDRKDEQSIINALDGNYFDYVFDNIAYNGRDIERLLPHLKCNNYVQVSSVAAYRKQHLKLKEDELNTFQMPYISSDDEKDYGRAKLAAECVTLQQFQEVPAAIVRVPFVVETENLDNKELNMRLFFYVEHIMNKRPMKVDNLDYSCSFVRTNEEAAFLIYLAENNVTGVYNFSSEGNITIREIIEYIESQTGIKAIYSEDGDEHPFNAKNFGYVGYSFDLTKALNIGYQVNKLDDWIYALLDKYIVMFV
ncbi:MAG: NAD-dependent epimerase/dehydratase family protein [Lachnospiraceae bacterium]|nr:NAD-dependent epimerase/dehydratase family protein [Lachnospiraceae bacterium]